MKSGDESDVSVRGAPVGEGLVVGGFSPGIGGCYQQGRGQAGLASPGLVANDLNDGHAVS